MPRLLRYAVVLAVALVPPVAAHDLEKTQVTITFARDGSFVADVANDPAWLKLRLESIPGPFADRVVLWVDHQEVRPESVELIAPGTGPEPVEGLAIYRLRGRVPMNAQTLRWYYGLVIDPFPLTIHRADGRLIVEEVQGDAWSRTIDLSGQFHAPFISQTTVAVVFGVLLLAPLALRLATKPFLFSCLSWLRLR